jgi:hypothetical protein
MRDEINRPVMTLSVRSPTEGSAQNENGPSRSAAGMTGDQVCRAAVSLCGRNLNQSRADDLALAKLTVLDIFTNN